MRQCGEMKARCVVYIIHRACSKMVAEGHVPDQTGDFVFGLVYS